MNDDWGERIATAIAIGFILLLAIAFVVAVVETALP
jgi:hypothetical protein